ncbi:hypothetical protein ACFLZG_04520 [Thermodesulfobacteriota bacterium]
MCQGKGCHKILYDEFTGMESSEFANNVIGDAEKKAKETLRLTLKISDLPSLALKVCEGQGVDEAGLRSGLRKRLVVLPTLPEILSCPPVILNGAL